MGLPMTPSPMNPTTFCTADAPFVITKHTKNTKYLRASSGTSWLRDKRGAYMELTDKVALITGGKRIGLVVAGEIAARGVDVALSYARSRAEAEQAADRVRGAGRRAAIFQADLSQPEACEAVVAATVATFARLDILIHMASVSA